MVAVGEVMGKHLVATLGLLLGACSIDRWATVPATRYAEGDWHIEVKALPAGPDEWELRARSRDLHFVIGPLPSEKQLKAGAMRRAAELCGEHRPVIVTEAQRPPAIALFVHIRCEA